MSLTEQQINQSRRTSRGKQGSVQSRRAGEEEQQIALAEDEPFSGEPPITDAEGGEGASDDQADATAGIICYDLIYFILERVKKTKRKSAFFFR